MKLELVVKPTDEQLAEYIAYKKTINILTAKMEYIRGLCKVVGSYCTENHVCSVYEQSQTRLVGLDEVVTALTWDTLDQHDLIKVVSFDIVKVTEKKPVE